MRITNGMRYGSVLRNLNDLTARHAKASQKALTGNRMNAPSDDPLAAAELVRNNSQIQLAQTQRNAIRDARGDAELSESILDEANSVFQRAHEIAMQGANGNLSAENRADLATETKQLKEHLLSLANTRGSRGYLFGGSKTDTAPFAANGAFSGNDENQVIQVGSGNPMRINVSGANAFTAAGGRDVFADLDALATALNSNDSAAISGTLDGIETSRKQLVREQAQAGLTLNRLDTSDAALEQPTLSLSKKEQDLGAANPVEAYSQMNQLSQTLERAIAVSRQILDLGQNNQF